MALGMVNICAVHAAEFNPSSSRFPFVLSTYQHNNEMQEGGVGWGGESKALSSSALSSFGDGSLSACFLLQQAEAAHRCGTATPGRHLSSGVFREHLTSGSIQSLPFIVT